MMTHLATDLEAVEKLASAIRKVKADGERVVFQEEGSDVAALIPIGDLRLLERLIEEEEDRIDLAAVEEARKEPGFITMEEVMKKHNVRPESEALEGPPF